MPVRNESRCHIHPSVFHIAAGPLHVTEAVSRSHGALRYRCPISGALVLLTDEATLDRLNRPRVRLRCVDCGEMHLLTQETAQEPGRETVRKRSKRR